MARGSSSQRGASLNGNGHRRREIKKRVKAEEHECALCDGPLDLTIPYPEPMSVVVDEDIPRSRGGSQYDRANCHAMHRACNGWKGTMTLDEARAKLAGLGQAARAYTVASSDIW